MNVSSPCWRLFVVRRCALALGFCSGLCLLLGIGLSVRAEGNDTAVAPEALGSISGTVRDKQNQPLGGITVTLYSFPYSIGPIPLRTTTTLTDGQFTFLALRAGRYLLGFASTDGTWAREYYQDAPTLGEATEIIIAGNHVTGLDVVLDRAGVIEGMINIMPGLLPYGGDVSLYQEADGYWQAIAYTTLVTPTGTYQLSEIFSGTYRVCATGWLDPWGLEEQFASCYGGSVVEEATDIVVTSGETISGIDFSLGEGQFDGEIGGRVTSAGAPVAGIEVSLYNYVPGAPEYTSLLVYTRTNAAGEYSFGGLSGGIYAVGFSDPTGEYTTVYYPSQRTLYGASPIYLLTNEILDSINGELQLAGAISGRLLSAVGSPMSTGWIDLYYFVDGYWEPQFPTASRDEHGYYTLSGLTPGIYRICFPFEFLVGQPPIYGFFYMNCYGSDRFADDSLSTAIDLIVEAGETLTNIDSVVGPELLLFPQISR
jgi:hypothetical protein